MKMKMASGISQEVRDSLKSVARSSKWDYSIAGKIAGKVQIDMNKDQFCTFGQVTKKVRENSEVEKYISESEMQGGEANSFVYNLSKHIIALKGYSFGQVATGKTAEGKDTFTAVVIGKDCKVFSAI